MSEKRGDFIFTLGRAIDIKNKHNLMIVLLSLAGALVGWGLTTEAMMGLYLGSGIFLSWALTREIDPAHPYSAFVAASLSFLTFLTPDTFQAILVFWLLLLLRMVNGITGKELTLIDLFTTFGFTVFLSLTRENSLYLLVFGLAMVSLIVLGERSEPAIISAVLTFILFAWQTFFMSALTFISLNEADYLTGSLLVITILASLLFWRLSKVTCWDDKGKKANSARILSGQLLFCAAVFLFTLAGVLEVNDQLVYLAVVSGVIFYHIRVLFLK